MSIHLAVQPDTSAAITNVSGGQAPAKMVRVGVIGAGEQTSTHLIPALLHIPHAKITAIVDPIPARRDAAADRLGVSVRLSTVTHVLTSGLVDCLVAACPPHAHEEIAAAAIETGMPVFVEKPPAASTTALTQLAGAAERGRVLTGVGMNFRWAAPVHRLQTFLGDQRHGGPSLIAVRHMASKPAVPMWGLPLWQTFLLAQAIHPIDLMLAMAGAPAVEVHSACRQAGSQVWLSLQLHHANGTISSLHSGNVAPRFEHRIELSTSAGITASLNNLADLTISGASPMAGPAAPMARGTSSHWRPSPLDVGYDRTGFGGELSAFCTAVATGGRFAPSLSDLIPTYQIMDQLTPNGGSQ